jgi:(2Fe-2S) ferredoxin
VSVEVGDEPKVTYGKVNAERARRILLEHVVGGQPIEQWIIG